MKKNVILEKIENNIALIRINRPEALNALNIETRKQLASVFLNLHEDESIRCIILTGNEKSFVAGADIKEMVDASNIEVMKRRTEKYWNAISSTPQPVIAAVNGFALGGGLELAMMCDLIIVGENAQLGQPEVKIGIMPGAGGTQRITRAVGKFNSMKINLLGKPMSGIEAFNMGLACEVVPDEKVLDTAIKMANTISRMPPLSVQAIKETIINGNNASLETSLLLERKTFQVLLSSNDKKEGMEAFIEKRKPNFKGN